MTLTQPERIGSLANWTEIHQPAPVCIHTHTGTYTNTVQTAGTHAHSDLHDYTFNRLAQTFKDAQQNPGAHTARHYSID